MHDLGQDLRFAARMLVRGRGVTVVAVLALALGIGANTAIFSVVNAVLLRPLPYGHEERLVQIWGSNPARNVPIHNVFYRDIVGWRRQCRSFEALNAAVVGAANLVPSSGDAERVQMWRVNAGFLPMLGARPALGRTFLEEEDRLNSPRVAVLSHALWQRRFGSDAGLVGRAIQLDGNGYQVVGVLAPEFGMAGRKVDLYSPLAAAEEDHPSSFVTGTAYGRLRPGTSIAQAQAELTAIGRHMESANPRSLGRTPVVWGLRDFVVRTVKPGLLLLMAAVALVLLIACANVANILLARAAAREREMAVRCALGALRGRLLRQLLTESCLLALAGGACGLLLAWWGVSLLPKLAPAGYPMLAEAGVDWRVLLAALGISLATGILFGIAPALTLSGGGLNEALKEGSRTGESSARGRARSALVVAEVALAMLLAVGAGLLIRSFANLRGVNPGFNVENLLTAQVNAPLTRPPEQRIAFYTQLLERLKAAPGVRGAAVTNSMPLTGANSGTGMYVEGRPAPRPGDAPIIWTRFVSPDYFQVMETPLKSGRFFTDADTAGRPSVALINETAARRFWPEENPVGRRFSDGPPRAERPPNTFTVIGVVGDMHHMGLASEAEAQVFWPFQSQPGAAGTFVVVRTQAQASGFAGTLRGIAAEVDRSVPVAEIRDGEQLLGDSVAPQRFSSLLLGLFAALAVTLAAVGVYGVISYSVTRRTREIGIRMAMGARPGDVVAMVTRQALVLAGAGILIGLLAASLAGRVLRGLLFGVTATDPWIYLSLALLVAAVAVLAAFVPARRAAGVDPMSALRYE